MILKDLTNNTDPIEVTEIIFEIENMPEEAVSQELIIEFDFSMLLALTFVIFAFSAIYAVRKAKCQKCSEK